HSQLTRLRMAKGKRSAFGGTFMQHQCGFIATENDSAQEVTLRFFAAMIAVGLQKDYYEHGALDPFKRRALSKFASDAIDHWIDASKEDIDHRNHVRHDPNRRYMA